MPFYAVLGTPYLCIINKKITDMEITKTTYDTLPGQIDYLIQEVLEIKDILMARIEKPEEIPKFMNKEQALKYIRKQGYEISSSKFYKMSAADSIPCHRSGRKLYFFAEELDGWIKQQFETKSQTILNFKSQSIKQIIKSNKNKNYEKNNNIQMPNHPFKTAQDVKRYVRDILLQVQQEETLKKIIDITSKIDYAVIYHLDDDEALARLYELREKKKTGGLSEEEWKELWSLEPDDEIKYIILIEELLGNADVFNLGLGIEPDTLLPYIYTGCHWKNVSRPLLKEFLAVAANKADFNYYDIRLSRNIEKLYNQFVSLCTLVPNLNEKQDEVKINLQNGTFVISKEKKELRDFDKKDFFKYQLPFKYNPEAKCDEFKVFLNQVLPEKESQMILAEYLGYIFINNLKLEKCLILKGEGSNGKSVIFEIVQALLGEHNTCSYTISNLCNENGYFRAQLGNYLLNYSSELGGKNINPDLFKKLISNEPIDARSPYGHPFILRNYGKFMFNTNKFPNNIEFTHAYLRRFIILNFEVIIPDEKQDKNLAKRIISKELSGIFNWVLEGLDRLLKQQQFTESPKAKELLEEMRFESDTVAQFIEAKQYVPSQSKDNNMLLKKFREEYKSYCKMNELTPVGSKEFSTRIKSLGFKFERYKAGGSYYVFLNKQDGEKILENITNFNDYENIDESLNV